MNPRLARLQPYPFERLRALLSGVAAADTAADPPVDRRAAARDAGAREVRAHGHLDGSLHLSGDGGTRRGARGDGRLVHAPLPPAAPGCGHRGAPGERDARGALRDCAGRGGYGRVRRRSWSSPNPFYQIYEGAALLAGAEPVFLNQTAGHDFDLDLESLTHEQWSRTQLVYVCSPGNPTGHVLDLDGWRTLFECADRYGFVIASDECYSEIYPDEGAPPLGALEAAHALGRDDLPQSGRVHEPVEALERAGVAVRRYGRRRSALEAISALSHLSWMRDEPPRAARQHGGVE